MSYFEQVFERIKLALNVKTQMELADALRIKQSSISDAKKREAIPSEWLIKLYDKEGLNPDWLRWGKGAMRLTKSDTEPELREIRQETLDSLSHMLIRRGDALGNFSMGENSAGDLPLARGSMVRVLCPSCEYEGGQTKPSFTTKAYLVLPENFLTEDLLVFCVEGSSMEPTLKKGAHVGISTSVRLLVSGDIYALLMPFEGVVFRRIVQDSENGFYLLCCDQGNLPSMRLSAMTLRERMVGKVIWTLQSV